MVMFCCKNCVAEIIDVASTLTQIQDTLSTLQPFSCDAYQAVITTDNELLHTKRKKNGHKFARNHIVFIRRGTEKELTLEGDPLYFFRSQLLCIPRKNCNQAVNIKYWMKG